TSLILSAFFFFLTAPATVEIYTLSLHDALPILCELRVPSFVDCGDDFSGHAHPYEGVVPRSVVDDQPEESRQRPRSATRVGARQLPNRVVLAAQTKAGDGAAGPGTTVGNCRG